MAPVLVAFGLAPEPASAAPIEPRVVEDPDSARTTLRWDRGQSIESAGAGQGAGFGPSRMPRARRIGDWIARENLAPLADVPLGSVGGGNVGGGITPFGAAGALGGADPAKALRRDPLTESMEGGSEWSVKDVLRAYVNMRSAGGGGGLLGSGGNPHGGLDLGVETTLEGGLGLNIADEVLNMPADSFIGQLIISALRPATDVDGTIHFSLFGIGDFLAEATPDGRLVNLVNASTGKSLLSLSDDSSGREVGEMGKRKVKLSLTGFIWIMISELVRMPIFYIGLLGTALGIAVLRLRRA